MEVLIAFFAGIFSGILIYKDYHPTIEPCWTPKDIFLTYPPKKCKKYKK